jgi:hypothetical protein
MVAAREAVMPAAKYIRDDSKGAAEPPAVFSPNPIVASFIPTVATVRILWNPHLVSAGVVDEEENKQQPQVSLLQVVQPQPHMRSDQRSVRSLPMRSIRREQHSIGSIGFVS